MPLRKVLNLLNHSSYGLNSITVILPPGWLWHWITNKGWYAIKQRNQTSHVPNYSSRFWLHYFPDLSFTKYLYQIIGVCTKGSKYDWFHVAWQVSLRKLSWRRDRDKVRKRQDEVVNWKKKKKRKCSRWGWSYKEAIVGRVVTKNTTPLYYWCYNFFFLLFL